MGITGEIKDDRSSLGQLTDPNVTLRVNQDWLSSDARKELKLDNNWSNKSSLSIGEVQQLWKRVKEINAKNEGGPSLCLNELLIGAEISIPSLQIPERNPELERRIQNLKNKLDEQEYQRMTRDVSSSGSQKDNPKDSIGYHMKQMNSAIVAAIQFVISFVAAFFFGFSGVQVFTGDLDLAVRLLLGIGFAVIVAIAELYVLVVLLDDSESESKSKGQGKDHELKGNVVKKTQ